MAEESPNSCDVGSGVAKDCKSNEHCSIFIVLYGVVLGIFFLFSLVQQNDVVLPLIYVVWNCPRIDFHFIHSTRVSEKSPSLFWLPFSLLPSTSQRAADLKIENPFSQFLSFSSEKLNRKIISHLPPQEALEAQKHRFLLHPKEIAKP